jgi:hypothetical protein
MKKTAWAAIRKAVDDGHEWIDIFSFDVLPEGVRKIVDASDKATPHWAKDNPVVRIAEVTIEEVVR